MSCDLLPTEIPGPHFQGDISDALRDSYDLIILHPPCTRIALCGNSTYGRGMPKHAERIEALDWTETLWNTAKSRSPRVALEQPKSTLGCRIGKRTQKIQPYQFGHLEQKETWLWLYGLPSLIETINVYDEMMLLPRNQRERIHFMAPSKTRATDRSRTFSGIAEAMAEQWGNV